MRIHFCLWAAVLLSLPVFAQQELTQLEQQLDTAQGIARVQILNELSMHYNHKLRRYKPEQAMEHARKALQLAESIDYKDGEAVAYYRMGNVYAGQEDVNQQMAHYEKWLQVRKVQADPIKIGWALNQLVFLYSSAGNETELLRHYEDVKQMHQRHNRPLLAYSAAARVADFYLQYHNLKEWFRYQREAIQFLQESDDPKLQDYLRSEMELLSMHIRKFPPILDSSKKAEEERQEYIEKQVVYGFRLLEACGFEDITQTSVRLLALQAMQDSIPSLVETYSERWLAAEEAAGDWLSVGKIHRRWALFKQRQKAYKAALQHYYQSYQSSIRSEEVLAERHSNWSVAAAKGIVQLLSKEPELLNKRDHRNIKHLLEDWLAETQAGSNTPELTKNLLPIILKQQKALLEGL